MTLRRQTAEAEAADISTIDFIRGLNAKWKSRAASADDITALVLFCEKMALRKTFFNEYWSKAVEVAADVTKASSWDQVLRGMCHGVLAVDLILKFNIEGARKEADAGVALNGPGVVYYQHICAALQSTGLSFNETNLDALMDHMEKWMSSGAVRHASVGLYQCGFVG